MSLGRGWLKRQMDEMEAEKKFLDSMRTMRKIARAAHPDTPVELPAATFIMLVDLATRLPDMIARDAE